MHCIGVVGRDSKRTNDLKRAIKEYGLGCSGKPDAIISLGGDGTYLYSERVYPGIPKIPVKDSRIGRKCCTKDTASILKAVKSGRYRIIEQVKLEADVAGKKLVGVNDIVIRNKDPICCLRFNVEVNGKTIDSIIIGDGVIIATPFGSTAYFHSAGGHSFRRGIGIAFNNPTRRIKGVVVGDNSIIKVRIIRGKATVSADNNPDIVYLDKGVVKIRKSKHTAKLLRFR